MYRARAALVRTLPTPYSHLSSAYSHLSRLRWVYELVVDAQRQNRREQRDHSVPTPRIRRSHVSCVETAPPPQHTAAIMS